MSSEIKVDTISENTSAGGVTIDGVLVKDNKVDVNGTADGIILDADADTTISADTDDQIDFKAGGTDRMSVTSSGIDVTGAITASSASSINVTGGSALTLTSTDAGSSSGPVLRLNRNSGSPADNDLLGQIEFGGQDDGGNATIYARFISQIIDVGDGSGGSEDTAFRLQTRASGTLRSLFSIEGGSSGAGEIVINDSQVDMDFRVESTGNTNALYVDAGNDRVGIGTSSPSTLLELAAGTLQIRGAAGAGVLGCTLTCNDSTTQFDLSKGGTSSHSLMRFANTNGFIGSISTSGTSTAFNTSSDYRLKENVNYDWDGTTELKKLKPAKFNFIADASKTLDGFLAHEVSSIVPIAVSGDKDGVDENGDPVYQGIDQSKLVPLMVKTIQELEARIETLEAEVTALKE
jgi:hypothetical protein